MAGVAKGVLVSALFQILDKILGFGFVILAPRLAGLAAFGIYNVTSSIAHMFTDAAQLGLPQAIIREGGRGLAAGSFGRLRGVIRFSLVTTAAVAGGCAVLVFWAGGPLAGWLLDGREHAWAMGVAALAIPFMVVETVWLSVSLSLRVVRHASAVRSFGEPLLKVVFLAGLLWAGWREESVVWSFTLSMVSCGLIAAWLGGRLLRRIPAEPAVRPDRRELLAYSIPLVGPTLVQNTLFWLDTILLGFFTSNAEVGLFSLALKFILIPGMVITAFNLPVSPRLAMLLEKGEGSGWQDFYRQVTRWMFGLSLPFFLFFMFRARLSLSVFGKEFEAGGDFLAVLCAGFLLSMLVAPAVNLLTMAGRSRLLLFNAAVFLLLNVAGALIFLPRYGAMAMAWVICGSKLVNTLMMGLQVKRLFGVNPLPPGLFRLTLAGIPAVLLLPALVWIKPVSGFPLLQLAMETVVFFGVYFVSLGWLAMEESDRQVMRGMVRQIREHWQQIRGRRPPGRYL